MISQEHIFSVVGKAKILLPNWVTDAKVPPARALCCLRLSSRKFVPDNLYRSDGCMPHPRRWCSVFGTKGEVLGLRGIRETFDVDKQNGFSDDSSALSASPSGFVRFCVDASSSLAVSRCLDHRLCAKSVPVFLILFAVDELPPELTPKRFLKDELCAASRLRGHSCLFVRN
jgi:hypothetical protein